MTWSAEKLGQGAMFVSTSKSQACAAAYAEEAATSSDKDQLLMHNVQCHNGMKNIR
jgi:hypothetical protein